MKTRSGMSFSLQKIGILFLILLLIIVLTATAFLLLDPLVFWVLLAIAGVIAFKVLPPKK